MFDQAKLVYQAFLEPLMLCYWGACAILATIYDLIFIERRPWKVLNLSFVKEAGFGRLWLQIGSTMSGEVPELANLIQASARGVVIDIGTGTGDQLRYFKPILDYVEHVYCIEPNKGLHEKLNENAISAGLGQKYTIIAVGAQECLPKLKEFNIGTGTVDTVISVKALCGVPDVEKHVASDLCSLLKPGGTMIIWEHIRNRQSLITGIYQRILEIFWPHLMGSCHLTRDTDLILKKTTNWKLVDLKAPRDQPSYMPIPFVQGRLVKA